MNFILNSKNKINLLVCSLTLSMVLAGCSASENSTDLLSKIGEGSCQSVEIFSYDSTRVTFNIPKEALDFKVSRDGISVFETAGQTETQFIDADLTPGQTYRYRCEIIIDVNIGYQKIGEQLAVTLPDNIPPVFEGLTAATLTGSTTALLTWNPVSDAILSHFKVFKYVGTALDKSDFPATPVATLNVLPVNSNLVVNLGDELTYSFRVTACNGSDVCDDNNSIFIVNTPNTGPPLTTGATAANLNNGVVSLTAPWDDSKGHVAKRSIFRASVGTGAACPAVFGSYSLVNDVNILVPRITATTLAAQGVLNQNTKYCFVVRDTDGFGNTETNFNVQSVEVGDITPPDFTSLLTLTRDVILPENVLNLSFAPIVQESVDALLGVQDYLIYVSTTTPPTLPDADPCATGTLYQTISSAAYPLAGANVTLNIVGLSARQNHRVCVKAQDSSSNVSGQTPNAFAKTGDTTAPTFSGLQSASFNAGTASIDFTFIVPTDTDMGDYKVTVLRTTRGALTTVLLKDLGVLAPGVTAQGSFTLAEASLTDNDVVNIHVDACDDAGPTYNGTDNCSSTAAVVVLTIPDATPPPGFSGVIVAGPGLVDRSIQVSWNAPADWTEYAGFKVYYVDGGGSLVELNSSDCACFAGDCAGAPKTTCLVDQDLSGTPLVPSKNYEMYVSAYDVAGNQTTSYIAHSGGSKITATSRAQDLTPPTFNASMAVTSIGGAKVTFDVATDTQEGSLEIDYEIYRKAGSTFLCPITPDAAAPGCDNIVPTTVAQSALGVEGGKLFYTDATVVEGVTYFYQVCALDFANNRTCQAGAIGSVTITDATAPVIANVSSDKMFGVGDATWTVSFDISDNNGVAGLAVTVYRGGASYPSQAAPGISFKTRAGGGVVVDGAGAATFTDTGAVDVTTAYYLIKVQDAAGNKTFYEIRDMSALPVITNVVWPAPLSPAGNPVSRFLVDGVADFFIRIQGTDLDKITYINDALAPGGTPANADDVKHCTTGRIRQPQAPTEIICDFAPLLASNKTYTLYVQDQHGRNITFNSGTPWNYCDYADANGITDLRGTGVNGNAAYTLCSPAHVKLIGRAADRADGNPADYIGDFTLGRDIDFTGVTDFKGIPSMTAGEFYLDGMGRKFMNLTIDTSATGDGTEDGAAFMLGCTGSFGRGSPIFWRTTFYNFTIKTGAGKAAVMILNSNCTWPPGSNMIFTSGVRNSKIYSNNTAGFISAEMNLNQARLDFSIFDSTIFSTRPDDTTAVGGAFGKLTGTAVAERPHISSFIRRIDLKPAVGQTDAGYNIGGVVGELGASNIDFRAGGAGSSSTASINVQGGLDNIGGLIGRMLGTADNVLIQDYWTSLINIDATGSTTDHRGGLIGKLHYSGPGFGGGVNNLIIEGGRVINSSIRGNTRIGGLIGFLEAANNVSVRRHIASDQISSVSDTSIVATGIQAGGIWGYASQAGGLSSLSEVQVWNTDVEGGGAVGGLIGSSTNLSVLIEDSSYRDGRVSSALGTSVGGLVGSSYTAGAKTYTVLRSSVGGMAEIVGALEVGGLFGRPWRGVNTFSDNYVNDNVTVTGGNRVGGMFGLLRLEVGGEDSFLITNNVNYAEVTSNGANAGAFYGQLLITGGTSTFSKNYYKNDWPVAAGVQQANADPDVAGEIEGMGEGLAGLGVLGVQANYVGWDFVTIWEIRDGRAKLRNTTGIVGM